MTMTMSEMSAEFQRLAAEAVVRAVNEEVRARLEADVRAYRLHPDPAHLTLLYGQGLDGIARALEVEATSRPGTVRDDATARIDGWLRPPTPTAGPVDRRAGGDGYGLGASSPTA